MKKRIIATALVTILVAVLAIAIPTYAEKGGDTEKVEITFQNIPWGTDYVTVKNSHSEWELWAISGEAFITPSVDAILEDNDYSGLDFEYNDINIIANSFAHKIDVAGYVTSDLDLYFAYVPVNGAITGNKADSALYGAKYTFEPKNTAKMANDLVSKLTSLYGEPDEVKSDVNWVGEKTDYTHWSGKNDTELMLVVVDTSNSTWDSSEDKIVIAYAWRKGDSLLQTASDTLAEIDTANEQEVYGNGITDGL